MRDSRVALTIVGLLLLFITAAGVGCAVLEAYLTARAFERATGRAVSTWDALFLELHVDGTPPGAGAGSADTATFDDARRQK